MLKATASMGLKAISVALLLSASGQALAASATVTAQIDRVLMTADSTYGGCMALLSVNPADALPGCGSGWVTFSCSGDFTDRVRAYRSVDLAQLALASGKVAQVFFRDDMKHNGYCFADRIDVLR